MKTGFCMLWGSALTAGVILSGTAIAKECTGRWTNVGQSAETIDLGKGHTLTIFSARGPNQGDRS